MHSLQRFSASAQTIKAQLFNHERIIQERDGVGLYDGKERSAVFDDGRVHLTNHRLIYIDSNEPYRNSRCLNLEQIKQTEHWAGFLKSSAKITLVLDDATRGVAAEERDVAEDETLPVAVQSWTCHVCGFRNDVSAGIKCTLCGVTKWNSATPATSGKPSRFGTPSQSTPSSRPESPAVSTSDGAFVACPACTYLNHPSMQRCEICDSPLGIFNARPRRISTPAPATPSDSKSSTPTTPVFVKLSFRKGGDKAFYTALKAALQAKEWDNIKSTNRNSTTTAQIGTKHTLATYGINGILRTIDIDARDREDDMQEALGDLEALKKRAQDMVRMAEAFNAKLAATKGNDNDDLAVTVTRSLRSLGLEAPVIAASESTEDVEYHRKLAKELGAVLLGSANGSTSAAHSVMAEGDPKKELIGLDEVWCRWNRARGVALVSPEDLHNATYYLPEVTRPQIKLQVFKSGLNVLHLPSFSPEAFAKRMCTALRYPDGDLTFGLTTLDIARQEGVSVILTTQMLELLEDADAPPVVRDEGDLRVGVRWQLNLFEELERMV